MIDLARAADPSGRYVLIEDGDYGLFQPRTFDLILSTFAFDNIPGVKHRTRILEALGRLLRDDGRIVLVDCTPELYVNEWVSFSTKDFPENRRAGSGEVAYAVFTEVGDRRPVVDFIWFHDDYLELFAASGLDLIAHHQPLGRDDEPYAWVCETSIAPFSIYVLAPTKRSQHANRRSHLAAPS